MEAKNYSEALPDRMVGVTPAMPFDAALWAFTRHIGYLDSLRKKELYVMKDEGVHHMAKRGRHIAGAPSRRLDKADVRHEAPVAPAKPYAKQLKMLSLNPSIYGNDYSVLGSS